ncbi:MAG: WXG100 family type VII secretion target, partial [Actinomadura sp.]
MAGMTLNIQIKGDPAALQATARWLTKTAEQADGSARQVYLARIDSADGWDGAAAEGFRSVMSKARDDVDDVVADLRRTSAALTAYADELEGCRQGMRRAREIAAKAGLPTTDTTIDPPGAPPVAPQGLGMGPYAGEKGRVYKAYLGARNHYAAQVKAYYEAAVIANFARRKERQAQAVLLDFLDNFAKSSPFSATDLSVGIVGT